MVSSLENQAFDTQIIKSKWENVFISTNPVEKCDSFNDDS